jgi:hypothetical protein
MGGVCGMHGRDVKAHRILVKKHEGRKYFIDVRTDRTVILQLILEDWGMRMWIGFIWLRLGSNGGLL